MTDWEKLAVVIAVALSLLVVVSVMLMLTGRVAVHRDESASKPPVDAASTATTPITTSTFRTPMPPSPSPSHASTLSAAALPNPRIAFVTTCKNRAQHLKETLPRNLADNLAYPNCIFVVLDYGSRDDLAEFMRSPSLAPHYAANRLAYYHYPTTTSFQIGHAKNMAHRCGILESADILVNLDADNFTGPDFASYIAEQFASQPSRFLFTEMIPGVLTRGVNGRIIITRHQFLNAGGYDEKFKTWANDDKDFHARLMRLGYKPQSIDQRYLLAIAHTDKMRFKEYPHAADINFYDHKIAIEESDVTIANFGRIGCGIVYRNLFLDQDNVTATDSYGKSVLPTLDEIRQSKAIRIDPLPTRIFGIGMHKTATTSLHRAMAILGFDSAHWLSAHWAKAIWTEMKVWGRSSTLERSYHLCDLPIPMLFREIDQAYPGSKFILTLLDEEVWVTAAEIHWSRRNKWRAAWDTDPFTHKVHQELYGQRTFNREVFLARYRRHNAEVLAYFANRPDDLLVMRMSEGAGWQALCGFVGQPVPEVDYPHANPNGDMWMKKDWTV